MPQTQDFGQVWLEKLSRCLSETAGEDIRAQVMAGSGDLSPSSSPQEVVAWTQAAMARLETLLDEQDRHEVMTGCACQYPESGLREAKLAYQETGDVDAAHRILQAQFESFLRTSIGLDDDQVAHIVSKGWGLAGIRRGNSIVATKIPKSGYLLQYLEEPNPQRRREIYCHCPRVRDAPALSERISPTYCYCGAGFYKGIWEEILQAPVEVEVLKSVLAGDEVCTIAVNLPVASGQRSAPPSHPSGR
jgi:predicted hydrocarbon binding protein